MTQNKKVFDGKAGIVTGASSGIGREIAVALGAAGMDLWLVGRSQEQLQETAALITKAGGPAAVCVVMNLGEAGVLVALVEQVGKEHPYLFTLINNAGVMYPEALTATSPDHWREMMAINLLTPMESCSAAVRVMRGHGQPAHLINISSVAGKEDCYGAYGISKSGVDHLGRVLRRELEQDDIRSTTIIPGGFTTNLSRGFAPHTQAKLAQSMADSQIDPNSKLFRKLMGDPQKIAELVVYVLQQPIELNLEEITIRPAIDTKL